MHSDRCHTWSSILLEVSIDDMRRLKLDMVLERSTRTTCAVGVNASGNKGGWYQRDHRPSGEFRAPLVHASSLTGRAAPPPSSGIDR